MRTLIVPTNSNELASTLRHEGIRVAEIIAYRAWRAIESTWFHRGDDLLHSVLMLDYGVEYRHEFDDFGNHRLTFDKFQSLWVTFEGIARCGDVLAASSRCVSSP